MSFFKDFKEDLSQAVNELMPEEFSDGNAPDADTLTEELPAEDPGMVDTISGEEESIGFTSARLEDMLSHLDEISFETEDISNSEEAVSTEEPAIAEESVTAEETVLTEETEMPEETVLAEETEMPEETVLAEETEMPEESVLTEETEMPEESVLTEETEMPEESVLTEETETAEETVLTEEPEMPEESVLTEETETVEETVLTEEPVIAEESVMPEETAIAEEPVQADDLMGEEMRMDQILMEESVTKVTEENMQKEEKVETKMAKEMTTGLGDGPATDENSVITEGMTITGDITSMGSMEVLGSIVGNIELKGKLNISGTINGNSKAAEIFADSAKITGEVVSEGSVKVGQASVIVGNISATSAVIAGAVKGDIDVHGPVILDTSAIVMGDIKSKSVQINNGAVIEGHCSQCYADVSPTSFFSDLR